MLYREPKLLKATRPYTTRVCLSLSVLYREPKLLKAPASLLGVFCMGLSVLYREPKLLKGVVPTRPVKTLDEPFSALP